MTAKEKSEELVDKFHYRICNDNGISENESTFFCAMQCALICVDEVIKEHCKESENKNPIAQDRWISFWIEVKQELEKL